MNKTRLIAALVMAPVAILAVLLLPTSWLLAIAALVMLMGLWEWFALANIEDTLARSALLVAHLGVMVAIVWASQSSNGPTLVLFQLVTVVGVVWWLLSMLWLSRHRFASQDSMRARVFKLVAGALSVIPAWCALAWIHAEQPNGHRWLLLALAVVWAADSSAYFAGRKFGRRKLSPIISPNKTVEGLIGGLLAALVVAMLVAPLAGASLAQLPAVALVVLVTACFSAIGDLFESLLKRHAGVKDSGALIPGHGGILDRLDGVLAALPVFALGKAILGF